MQVQDSVSIQPISDQTAPNLRRRRFLKQSLLMAGLVGGGLIGVDTDALKLQERDVRLPGWPQTHAGFRLGQLSDFHCDGDPAAERIHRSVAMLSQAKPDAVVLTGDYITHQARRWMPLCLELLTPLLAAAPYGVYCVLGNHDWKSGGEDFITALLQGSGMTVLRNQSVVLPNVPGVHFIGLDDCCMAKQNMALAIKNVPPDAHKILLVHEPDYADNAPAGFSLQLSGHSHGGQIRLPGLPVLYAPYGGQEYPEGLQQGKNHLIYTTRGVGLLGIPMRYYCPPEVTLLRLHPA